MKFREIITCLAVASLIILGSCTPQPCYQITNATVKADFFQTGTGKSLIADSVTLFGIGMDTSRIYSQATGLHVINIPLNPSSDSSSFYLKINNITDTVTFYYSSYTHLVSKECGYTYYFILTRPVKHDKVLPDYNTINAVISTVNEENVRIFY
ncbi:MAG TPA: DUF6452 family protein [Bacteroidales bacterium]|nr:DUF6452 family protein [Bacteroidales bacterium]